MLKKHYKIKSSNKRGDRQDIAPVVSVDVSGLYMTLKIQKRRIDMQDLYFLLCQMVKDGTIGEDVLQWQPKNTTRGVLKHVGFSGADDTYVAFKDAFGFIHKRWVIHTTMSGFVSGPTGTENRIEFFLPDLLTVFLECKSHFVGNRELVDAILKTNKFDGYSYQYCEDGVSQTCTYCIQEVSTAELEQEADMDTYSSIEEYAKQLLEE